MPKFCGILAAEKKSRIAKWIYCHYDTVGCFQQTRYSHQ